MIYKIATSTDARNVSGMRNHIEVRRYLHNATMHTEKDCEEWLEDILRSKTMNRIAIYYSDLPETMGTMDGRFVGLFRIDNIDEISQTCYVGLDIDPPMQGKAFSNEIYRHMLNELFNISNMRVIYLEALDNNDRGIHIYKKLGFQECGRFPKKIQRFGREIDSVIMYLDRDMLT